MHGFRAIFISLIALVAIGMLSVSWADGPPALTAQRGEGILLARCAVCHSVDLVRQQRVDRRRWEATVKKMIQWGADLSQEEAMLLVDYLSARYHSDAPDREPVSEHERAEPLPAPEGATLGHLPGAANRGEELYTHNCQACHGSGANGGMGPKLAGNPILQDDDRFGETVLHGRGAMPAWASVLSTQEVADIHGWLRTLK